MCNAHIDKIVRGIVIANKGNKVWVGDILIRIAKSHINPKRDEVVYYTRTGEFLSEEVMWYGREKYIVVVEREDKSRHTLQGTNTIVRVIKDKEIIYEKSYRIYGTIHDLIIVRGYGVYLWTSRSEDPVEAEVERNQGKQVQQTRDGLIIGVIGSKKGKVVFDEDMKVNIRAINIGVDYGRSWYATGLFYKGSSRLAKILGYKRADDKKYKHYTKMEEIGAI
jgi:hypothetical protein